MAATWTEFQCDPIGGEDENNVWSGPDAKAHAKDGIEMRDCIASSPSGTGLTIGEHKVVFDNCVFDAGATGIEQE